jgi:hypothetical protein
MDRVGVNPLFSLLQFLRYSFSGRIRFPTDRIGETIALDDGLAWRIFRQVVIEPGPHQPRNPGAVFRARFHLRSMSFAANKRFSLLPIPFFTGLPGFRSKLWLYNEITGDNQGYYEWDTIADAENYRDSFAAKFMARRSTPGSVNFTITPKEQPISYPS